MSVLLRTQICSCLQSPGYNRSQIQATTQTLFTIFKNDNKNKLNLLENANVHNHRIVLCFIAFPSDAHWRMHTQIFNWLQLSSPIKVLKQLIQLLYNQHFTIFSYFSSSNDFPMPIQTHIVQLTLMTTCLTSTSNNSWTSNSSNCKFTNFIRGPQLANQNSNHNSFYKTADVSLVNFHFAGLTKNSIQVSKFFACKFMIIEIVSPWKDTPRFLAL